MARATFLVDMDENDLTKDKHIKVMDEPFSLIKVTHVAFRDCLKAYCTECVGNLKNGNFPRCSKLHLYLSTIIVKHFISCFCFLLFSFSVKYTFVVDLMFNSCNLSVMYSRYPTFTPKHLSSFIIARFEYHICPQQ